MTKIAIFLCVVLFAAATDAFRSSERLSLVQQQVETFVAANINLVELNRVEAVGKARQLYAQLGEAVNLFINNVIDDLKNLEQKASDDINRVVLSTKVDVTDCNRFKNHLYVSESAAFSAMNQCISDKNATGLAFIQQLDNEAKKFLGNLAAIREEARRCLRGVVGLITRRRATKCTARVADKGRMYVNNYLPTLTGSIATIHYFLAALPPSVADCRSVNELAAFKRELLSAVSRTKTCVRQKIEEAHALTTPSTTETIVPTTNATTTLSPAETIVPTTNATTTLSTTEKPVSTTNATTTLSTTETTVSTTNATTTLSTTVTIVPTTNATTTLSPTETIVPTTNATTTLSTTEKPVSTMNATTTLSTTEKPVSTTDATTTLSTTEKPVSTTNATTTLSTTEKPVSTTNATIPDPEMKEFLIIGEAPSIPTCSDFDVGSHARK